MLSKNIELGARKVNVGLKWFYFILTVIIQDIFLKQKCHIIGKRKDNL